MKAALDFYFDFASPYGYFAAMRIEELAARHGRDVNWHPILLGVVFKTTGGAPLPSLPLKGDYGKRDMDRTARFHRIAYRFPSAFPLSTQAAARGMLWTRSQHGDDKAVAFAKAVYVAYFVDDVNIGDPVNLGKIAAAMELDATAFAEGINSPPIKDQLKAEVDLAMARGVFGSPYVIADGEPFWGFDRFDQLEALLADGKIGD